MNNIMCYRRSDGKVIGVLCDWDVAKEIAESDIGIDIITRDAILSQVSPPPLLLRQFPLHGRNTQYRSRPL